jgi:hypothetical protein
VTADERAAGDGHAGDQRTATAARGMAPRRGTSGARATGDAVRGVGEEDDDGTRCRGGAAEEERADRFALGDGDQPDGEDGDGPGEDGPGDQGGEEPAGHLAVEGGNRGRRREKKPAPGWVARMAPAMVPSRRPDEGAGRQVEDQGRCRRSRRLAPGGRRRIARG